MKNAVKKNKYGFYSLVDIPTVAELSEYYAKKYYQEAKGSYELNYSKEEIAYFNNKTEQKHYLLMDHLEKRGKGQSSLLDIGSGEGWTLKYFKNAGWKVRGIDYSDYGCRQNNPDCLDNLLVGDIYQIIDRLKGEDEKYDVIWLDNVLEHVIDPLGLLLDCRALLKPDGICVIEVPNDYSVLQRYLLENKYIENEFWVAIPDHIHYFNQDGLKAICHDAGLELLDLTSDYPIDINLLNENTNYIRDKAKGKSCHRERVAVENLLHSISMEKTVGLYRSLAKLGLGREITGYFGIKKGII